MGEAKFAEWPDSRVRDALARRFAACGPENRNGTCAKMTLVPGPAWRRRWKLTERTRLELGNAALPNGVALGPPQFTRNSGLVLRITGGPPGRGSGSEG